MSAWGRGCSDLCFEARNPILSLRFPNGPTKHSNRRYLLETRTTSPDVETLFSLSLSLSLYILFIYIYLYSHLYLYLRIYIYIYIAMFISIYLHLCMYMYMDVDTYTYTLIYTCTSRIWVLCTIRVELGTSDFWPWVCKP